MRILILISIICHVHILNCSNIPKFLKCIDNSCNEQISTGRIIKTSKPIYGNLGNLKITSKVNIKGKNVDLQNTLWLVEKEGFYGFIDLSFIKENKNSVNDDLSVFENPYYKNQLVDETEDNDDSTNEVRLFSKDKLNRKIDVPMKNDETENFSEQNSSLSAKIENLNNNENTETINKSPNIDMSISNLDHETKIVSESIKNNALPNIGEEFSTEKSDIINGNKINIPNEKHQSLNLVQKLNDNFTNAKENLIKEKSDSSKHDLKALNVEQKVEKSIEPKENIEEKLKEITKLDENMKSQKNVQQKGDTVLKSKKNIELSQNVVQDDQINKSKNIKQVAEKSLDFDKIKLQNNNQQKVEKDFKSKENIDVSNAEQSIENLKTQKIVESLKNFEDSTESLENIQQKPEENSTREVIEISKNVEQNIKKDFKLEKTIESSKNVATDKKFKDNIELIKNVHQNSNKNVELPVENVKKNSNDEVKLGENIESHNNDQNKMTTDSKKNNIELLKNVSQKSINLESIESNNTDINVESDSSKQINHVSLETNKSIQDQSEKDSIMKKEIFEKSMKDIRTESAKSLKTDDKLNQLHSKQDEKLLDQTVGKENISTGNEENLSQLNSNHPQIQNKFEIENQVKAEYSRKNDENFENSKENSVQKEIMKNPKISLPDSDIIKSENSVIENEKINESEKINKILNNPDQIKNSESESVKLTKDIKIESSIRDSSDPINGDPWLGNAGKCGLYSDKDMVSNVRSPVIKLILKLDLLSQVIIKSIMMNLGFDSSSKLSQFTNNWLQMSLENFVSIFLLFSVLFFVIYTPKIFKFNRDRKSEFLRQSQLMRELESKLQSIEEVRHKLTVQNHNFEKVIEEYKQQINEIQEDAAKNKKTVILEVEKIKKNSELNVKNLTMDLGNKIKQCEILENDIYNKTATIDNLEEEKRVMGIHYEDEKSQLEIKLSENKRELSKIANLNEQLKHLLQQSSLENEQLRIKLQESNQELVDKNESYSQLEKSFENLKIFEGLNFEEYNEKKAIYLDLTQSKQQYELAKQNIEQLKNELSTKCEVVLQLEEAKKEMNEQIIQFENQKVEAITQKEAAEMKLNVLSEYFKSKEVEMAKTLGHQVIEGTQSLDQIDYLKHRIQILETDNEEMSKIIPRLKSEIKDAQTFAAKCKSDASEEINKLFIKSSNLERSLLVEKDENKKLRTKLSHYCGPTPPRNQTSSYNHNNDRPPSRQSGFSDSVGTFVPLSFIPFLPQSPTPNNQFSSRNSVTSKKSNNT